MEITEDQVETESGKRFAFGVVHKKPFALIIPWDGRCFTLVGQYRYPVDRFSWEFPQGHFEHDTVFATARKELEEETGLKAGEIKEMGGFYLAPGHHTQICNMFLATQLSAGKIAREETEEGMKTKRVSLEEFQKMVIREEITDGPTLAAFSLLRIKGLP